MQNDAAVANFQQTLLAAIRKMNTMTLTMAYQAWLGFYNSNLRFLGWSKEKLVAEAGLALPWRSRAAVSSHLHTSQWIQGRQQQQQQTDRCESSIPSVQ